jgi:hypothetical protein
MSSILDALEKLEAASPQAARAPVVGRTETRRSWMVVPVIGVAFAAGIGLALLLRPKAAPVPAPPPLPLARPVPPPPHVEAPAVATAPGEGAPAEKAADAPVVNVAAPVTPPPAAQVVAAVPPTVPPQVAVAVPPPAPVAAKPAPSPVAPPVAAPAPERVAAARPPAGAPAVRVSFLAWSRAPERRTVALSIGDGSMTTLHEGERSDRIEVVEILPDGVRYRLDDGERVFTARAHD